MKITKRSTFNLEETKKNPAPYLQKVDLDLQDIATAFQGRIRFGTATDGYRGQNISGEYQIFTTSGTPNAENTIGHTLGAVPTGFDIKWRDKAGNLYQGPATGTAWTSSNIYLKCDVASVQFCIFLNK